MELKIHSQSGPVQLHARTAIIAYMPKNNSDKIGMLTMHPITQNQHGTTIEAGVTATSQTIRDMLNNINGVAKAPLELIQTNVIAQNDDVVVWWVPAKLHRIAFRAKSIGTRAAVVPHPPLVFYKKGDKYGVFALHDNERPTGTSQLAVAPYFNVSSEGSICTGSTILPKGTKENDVEEIHKAFFHSAFTYSTNHSDEGLIKHTRGEDVFWTEMLDGKYKRFPMKKLLSANLTVQQLLLKLDGGH